MKMTPFVKSRLWSSRDCFSCSIYATGKSIKELNFCNYKFRWLEGCNGAFRLIYTDVVCSTIFDWLVAHCFTPISKVPHSYKDGNVPFITVISEDSWHTPIAERLAVELSLPVFTTKENRG